MAKCIPAGFEDDYDDEFDDYDYDEEEYNYERNADKKRYPSLVDSEQPLSNETRIDTALRRQTFIEKQPRYLPGTPSSDSLLLDDIRVAIFHDNLFYVKSRIDNTPDFVIDTILSAGWTSLMYASSCGFPTIVEYCLELGADPNYHRDNFTPLMAVCSSNRGDVEEILECAKLLIQYGANVNANDRYGNSPLLYGAKYGKYKVVIELIRCGATVNHVNRDGWSALHFAARDGHGLVIRRLINSNIDVTIMNHSGKDGAKIAAENGFDTISDILERVKLRTAKTNNNNNSESEATTANASDPNQEETTATAIENANEGETTRRLSVEDSQLLETRMIPIKSAEQQLKQYNTLNNIQNSKLEDFLRTLNLYELLPKFIEKGFGYESLAKITEEDLENIGIKELTAKKKIMNGIVLVHRQPWKKESLRELSDNMSLTCPDVLAILSNISNHIEHIEQSIVFLREKLQKDPQIMKYKTDVSSVSRVRDENLSAIKNTRSLFQEFKSFHNELKSFNDSVTYDQIEELNDDDLFSEKSFIKSAFCVNSFIVLSVGVLSVMCLKYGSEMKQQVITNFNRFIPDFRLII